MKFIRGGEGLNLSLLSRGKGVKIYTGGGGGGRVKFILNFSEVKGLKFIKRGKG